MQLIVPGLRTASTPLGYGCSQLMGGITRRESIALLETAFDAGIRHFDTAPSYGYGQAESVLGEALLSRRDKITITTKFGIRPPRRQNLLRLARRLVLPAVTRIPSVKSRLGRAAAGLKGRADFSPAELRQSIESSLLALKADCIDILLLHEANVDDLSDELFVELERNVRDGKIRTFGIGSEAAAAAGIYRGEPRFCRIMQFEWSVLSRARPACHGSFVITHRSLSASFVRLRDWLAANPKIARNWSKELGQDVANASVLSRLMLAAARNANAGGITLFSSRSPHNIRANARLMLDDSRLRTGAALAALVARDAPAILQPQSDVSDRQTVNVC
jgi:D-threo-aldose 1-dehydrogenase